MCDPLDADETRVKRTLLLNVLHDHKLEPGRLEEVGEELTLGRRAYGAADGVTSRKQLLTDVGGHEARCAGNEN